MPENQQATLVLILMAVGIGALLLIGAQTRPPAAAGATAVARATAVGKPLTQYTNEERWELRRDSEGRLSEIVVHRDARASAVRGT